MPAFAGADAYRSRSRILLPKQPRTCRPVFFTSLSELFDSAPVIDGMTLSFHHHLRNGDKVTNAVCTEILRRGLKNLTLAPSSVFPTHAILADLISQGNVTNLRTNYINGPAAVPIEEGKLRGLLLMDTHGGRARAIESGELPIDVAFLATPAVDRNGNGSGTMGPAACGSLGYAQPDLHYAKYVVLVTDTVVDVLDRIDLDGSFVDAVLVVDSIGDPEGIVSGTTRITRDPVGLKIALDATRFLWEVGAIRPGFSMQTGAGGTSLAVAAQVRRLMREKSIRGSFASGGITGYFVDMLEEGLFERLYDVQCFDLAAVRSLAKNPLHQAISASRYGNPFDPDPVVDGLSFVILGATEIDLDFNVNVTTDSFGHLIGGSGGHADTAHGAKITLITTNLTKARLPIVKERVTTLTTPGEDVDVLVTERGIAIRPDRLDLIEATKNSRLPIQPIEELLRKAHALSGIPKELPHGDKIIGHVLYRDGTVIDNLYQLSPR
jgi:citrate lyase subunit alpha/citrate CoA-transferase